MSVDYTLAHNVMQIMLRCKVIEDLALQRYSPGSFETITRELDKCVAALGRLERFKPPGQCDPPCVPCGDVCVCPND